PGRRARAHRLRANQEPSVARAAGLELEDCPRAHRAGGRMSRRRDKASPSMAAAAMSLVQLERWLRDRAERRPVATSMPVLDGYVAAIVAGPVSISPLDWICPLLGIDADAFNHGGPRECAALSAVVQHYNPISKPLSNTPKRLEPIHQRE